MCSRRFFMHFGYIGTTFIGSQRQVKGGNPRPPDYNTVQGMLEIGLKRLNPYFDTVVFMASRTDSGVHALNATCHFDLQRLITETMFEPTDITHGLNLFFIKNETPIRVIKTQVVPDDFHSRNCAKSRTYLYRTLIGLGEKGTASTHFVPIEASNRANFYCTENFDIEMMRKAAKMFEGFHDFRTFMGKVQDSNRITRREIFSIEILERKMEDFTYSDRFSWPAIAETRKSNIILDIYFNGKGFLYKQVRRTTATLLSAGAGRITLKDIQFMLQVPSKHSWNSQIKTVPGYGLYLCNIEY
ncbi:hypothetical protein ABEB36_012019 [Hypothenemus hampei]|uniref:tRNA pseudouridine synthase n=1 Tax=Hypothenemus hampei TaxID=57062 RepID=A0ABD1E9U6_HYPHA